MHYYEFNIGNYRRRTQHLTPIEHYIYRELIDWYYLDEAQIPKKTQQVMRRLQLGSEYEKNLLNVLEDFFTETENGYKHDDIDEKLTEYHARAETSRNNGRKGGRPKSKKKQPDTKEKTQQEPSRNPAGTQTKGNHKPITNNHKPKTKDILDYSAWPGMPNEQTMNDWISVRKKKNADVTQTVINQYGKELHKAAQMGFTVEYCIAECVTRNWQGFKAEWLSNSRGNHNGQGTAQGASRAQRFNDQLDEIARRDIEQNGIT